MTEPRSAVPATTTPPPGRYVIDPEHTTIKADVRAMFGLLMVHGTFRLRDGEVQIAADPGKSTVRASIDAGSFASGLAKRDADVISADLLDASNYPAITFTGGEPRPEGSGWVLPGSVTAHGTTVPTEIQVTVTGADTGEVRFHAVARVDRASFGVTKKKGMVGRAVNLTIDATGRPA
jgi:polyisoprenoid-binding protein YceI